jgi:hypothetical protein
MGSCAGENEAAVFAWAARKKFNLPGSGEVNRSKRIKRIHGGAYHEKK